MAVACQFERGGVASPATSRLWLQPANGRIVELFTCQLQLDCGSGQFGLWQEKAVYDIVIDSNTFHVSILCLLHVYSEQA